MQFFSYVPPLSPFLRQDAPSNKIWSDTFLVKKGVTPSDGEKITSINCYILLSYLEIEQKLT